MNQRLCDQTLNQLEAQCVSLVDQLAHLRALMLLDQTPELPAPIAANPSPPPEDAQWDTPAPANPASPAVSAKPIMIKATVHEQQLELPLRFD